MNHAEFQTHMVRLASTFGKAAYSDERIKLIFKAVERFSAAWWESAVDSMIAYSRQAPLMTEIGELISREREREWDKKKQDQPKPEWAPHWSCSDCKDRGVWLAKNKTLHGVYAFRCACNMGLSDPRKNIPLFKQDHINQGFYYYEHKQ